MSGKAEENLLGGLSKAEFMVILKKSCEDQVKMMKQADKIEKLENTKGK